MGVLYSAFPVDKEVREWLTEEGIPTPASEGRSPTPDQLATALNTLDDQNVEFNIGSGVWHAYISDPDSPDTGAWTLLNVMDYTEPDEPCTFYFEKGSPELIVKVVHRIAQQCGAIAIVPDTGCPPAVVEPGSNIDDIIATWEHITG